MKVGNGNSFLPLEKQLGGLWVGYDGVPIPNLNSKGLCENGEETADLRYMAAVSQKNIRDRIRIVSYSKDKIQIFKITNDLKYLKDTKAIKWDDEKLYSSFPRSWWQSVNNNFDGLGSKAFYDHFFKTGGWKLIPTSLANSLPRENILAPIDSLSVWQSFNRKTFQPMFTLKGNEYLGQSDWLDQFPSLAPLQISETETLTEGRFGKLIRLYLNAKCNGEKSPFSKIAEEQLIKTSFAILNPAQVETLAMHLCSDLGLTVDVGLGKGLDVADVKATVRHLDQAKKEKIIDGTIKKLNSIGVSFSEKLLQSFKGTATLRIQCKARPVNHSANLGSVLLIAPRNGNESKVDTLFLDSLASAKQENFPSFFEWLKVLVYDLKN